MHGANFSLWTDGEVVKAARRSGFIPEGESFYGSGAVIEHYSPLVLGLAKHMGAENLVLFGELVGEGIQKGVNYCEGKDFYVFDVAHIIDGHLVFIDYTEDLVNTLNQSGFNTVPTLKWGSFEDVMSLDNLFESKFGGFTAEGYVAKPVVNHRLNSGSRVIIKSKNPKFSERKPSTKTKVIIPDDIKGHVSAAESYITDNRLNNLESKEGKVQQELFGKFMGMLTSDAIEEYMKDNDLELNKSDVRTIKKMLQPAARDIIKRRV
jgi:Rnl2 family RNA ligase